MRPLPRVLAFTDDRVAAFDDLGVRAAAIAAVGAAVALVARFPSGSVDQLAALAARYVALATPPMAAVHVTGRADVALSVGAHGVILRKGDLDVATVRQLCHPERSEESRRNEAIPRAARDDIQIFRSVHSFAEAEAVVQDGADAVIVGPIWPSATHPGRAGAGTGLLREVVSLGRPVFAIGGVTPTRAVEARAAGAWGVAAISAVWDTDHPYRSAMELVRILVAA